MYGTQAYKNPFSLTAVFENDVKMYGTQAGEIKWRVKIKFENDVKMYGTQAQNYQLISTKIV